MTKDNVLKETDIKIRKYDYFDHIINTNDLDFHNILLD